MRVRSPPSAPLERAPHDRGLGGGDCLCVPVRRVPGRHVHFAFAAGTPSRRRYEHDRAPDRQHLRRDDVAGLRPDDQFGEEHLCRHRQQRPRLRHQHDHSRPHPAQLRPRRGRCARKAGRLCPGSDRPSAQAGRQHGRQAGYGRPPAGLARRRPCRGQAGGQLPRGGSCRRPPAVSASRRAALGHHRAVGRGYSKTDRRHADRLADPDLRQFRISRAPQRRRDGIVRNRRAAHRGRLLSRARHERAVHRDHPDFRRSVAPGAYGNAALGPASTGDPRPPPPNGPARLYPVLRCRRRCSSTPVKSLAPPGMAVETTAGGSLAGNVSSSPD